MLNLYELSITEASRLIRLGELSPNKLLDELLNRINKIEPQIQAWVTLDQEGAKESAEKLTREVEDGKLRGPMHGIAIGVKDIFYTAGLKTTMGSAIYKNYIPSSDATTVAKLREAGGIILGKTETTEFASQDPAPTRNPWNLEHTPGGSSSGSAAAVSSGMCLAALGSQTGGSVIRPASYCGIVGMKPTYDLISRNGVYPLSWSLDHVGFFTRTVEDSSTIYKVLSGSPLPLSPEPIAEIAPPRFGLIRGFFQEKAHEDVWAGFEKAIGKLMDRGAEFEETSLLDSFNLVHGAHRLIVAAEAASVHEENFKNRRSDYREKMRGLIASGLLVPASAYIRAQRIRGRFIKETLALSRSVDYFVTPSTTTPALKGLGYTGDPAFNAPWSFCGFPVITIPMGLTPEKLPLGIQIIGYPHKEANLLETAKWCEKILDFPKEPREPI